MARGPRKTIEEKIQVKQEIISQLEARLDAEQTELEELLREKRLKELEAVSDLILESGLEPEQVASLLRDYVEEQSA